MGNLSIEQYRIAGGNQTALVQGANREDYVDISKRLLQDGAEQVGFVTQNEYMGLDNAPFGLYMMGGELCVNACLAMSKALPSYLADSKYPEIGQFVLNNRQLVECSELLGKNSVCLELTVSVFEKAGVAGVIVLLDGIGYRVTTEEKALSKSQLRMLCEEFKRPAFGDILRQENQIAPYVYVLATDSLVAETACGSGSIAAYLAASDEWERKELSQIMQPTGKLITVSYVKDDGFKSTFVLNAEVDQIS